MDKTLEMRLKIEAVFEHYAQRSAYYRRANVAQRIVMEDRFFWLTMELLSKIVGPFEGMEPRREAIFTPPSPLSSYVRHTAQLRLGK